MLISICLCTYRRPDVTRTLDSIAAQRLPSGCTLDIVVVDNDASGSAAAAVRGWSERAGLPVAYAVEPGPNIAAARNRTLQLARGDWLAFLDDDEVATPDWLAQLLRTVAVHRADAAIGRVTALYPNDAPTSLRQADPLSRDWGATGRRLDSGSTSNALVNADLVRHLALRFDERFGRTGGEDSDFFSRFVETGAQIVAASEAVVIETVPPDRLDPTYLRRRALRAGQSYGEIRLRALAGPRRLLFLAGSSVKAAGYLLFAGLLDCVGWSAAWRMRIRGWLNAGKLRACLGRPTPIMY